MPFHGAKDNAGSRLAAPYAKGSGSMQVEAGGAAAFGPPPFWLTVLPPGHADAAGVVTDPAGLLSYECTGVSGDTLAVAPLAGDAAFPAGSAAIMYVMAGHLAELQVAVASVSYTQTTPGDNWMIVHNLGRYPFVMVLDANGAVVDASVVHLDTTRLRITFGSLFAGTRVAAQ